MKIFIKNILASVIVLTSLIVFPSEIFAAKAASPKFNPEAGTYYSTQHITLSSTTPDASFRYTIDGTSPSKTRGILYTGPITINSNTVIKAVAWSASYSESSVASANYKIHLVYVETPVFSPRPGTYGTVQNVTLTCATSHAIIYYTTDGSAPSPTTSAEYSAPITVASTMTIKAVAIKSGMENSIILSGTFTIQLSTVGTPVFSPPGGTYNNDQTITLSSPTTGASIRYTTDGTLPSSTSGTVFNSPIAVTTSTTFKAIAFKTDQLDSEVTSVSYLLKCSTPAFNPPAGNIDRPQLVTISTLTTGAAVRYTTDGSEPTESTGSAYSGPVQVNTGQTLKAIAFKNGYTHSDTGSASYTLTSPDSDGDGVTDPEDEYPNDAQRAMNTYFPATGKGTLAFEDLWPAKGDYDLNDVVVDYSFKTIINGSNQLVETYATFVLRASGAALKNGFGFQFSNNSIPLSGINATGMKLTRDYITLSGNGLEANQAKPVIVVFDNVFDLFANPGSGSGFNTTPGAKYVDPVTIDIHIVYTPNTYSVEALDIEHFNPFIIVNMERGKEVHLPDYAPTSLADMNLFGTSNDYSIPAEKRYYKTITNAPWALNFYESFDYPIEKGTILNAYLHFAEWVQSGGTLYPDWYKNLSGYRNTDYIYQK